MAVNTKYRLAKRPRLIERVLLIEGITRSGKFLLGNILSAIEGVEHHFYSPFFEHMPFLMRLKMIDPDVAKAIIQNRIDNSGYETMIARYVNFRYGDKSSIYKSPKMKTYLRRSLMPDGDRVVEEIRRRKPYFPFVVHEVLPNISVFFDIYSKLKVLRIERHPVDLVYSWFKRGWGWRWGVDLKDFDLPLEGIKGPIPWFAYDWAKDYERSSEMDRIIKCMYRLCKMNEDGFRSLKKPNRDKIHILSYERLFTQTDDEIKKIGIFLGKRIMPEMEEVKAREALPAPDPALKRERKMAEIRKKASAEWMSRLLKMGEEYDMRWGL